MAIFNTPNPKLAPSITALPGEGSPAEAPSKAPTSASTAPFAGDPEPPQVAPTSSGEFESLIAPDLTVEGKIQGAGHIRIAGRFKGDVQVEGNLTLEPGARINGAVQARKVTIGGELDGNIDAAAQVELLPGGAIQGDIKAGQVTVAAGARLRGHVEFGWDDSSNGSEATPHKGSNVGGHYQPGGAP